MLHRRTALPFGRVFRAPAPRRIVTPTMRTHTALLLLGLAALAVATERTCVSQTRISGRASVTDGDSIEIGDTRLRLFGVDAVEGRQSCRRDSREWACGDEAARTLRNLIGNRTV